jgi:hypothetical protein
MAVEVYKMWNPEDANGDDFKNLTVEFKADNSVTVKENEITTQTGAWAITRLQDGYFKLSTNPQYCSCRARFTSVAIGYYLQTAIQMAAIIFLKNNIDC